MTLVDVETNCCGAAEMNVQVLHRNKYKTNKLIGSFKLDVATVWYQKGLCLDYLSQCFSNFSLQSFYSKFSDLKP